MATMTWPDSFDFSVGTTTPPLLQIGPKLATPPMEKLAIGRVGPWTYRQAGKSWPLERYVVVMVVDVYPVASKFMNMMTMQ